MRRTRKLTNFAVHLTVLLVLATSTICSAVAQPGLQDAAAVLASKFLATASLCLFNFRVRAPLLILAPVAVILPVAAPSCRNAGAIVALELGRRATAQLPRTVLLVAPVAAVVVAVATETIENTSP